MARSQYHHNYRTVNLTLPIIGMILAFIAAAALIS